jgi:hypothetical protein
LLRDQRRKRDKERELELTRFYSSFVLEKKRAGSELIKPGIDTERQILLPIEWNELIIKDAYKLDLL